MNPSKLAMPLILLLLAGAGFAVYRVVNQPTQQADGFRAILNLTPGDLLMNCGEPTLNTIGVVGDSAGVQDLHYRPTDKDEIVFRFITEDDKHWTSLGAWERVNAVDALGVPVSATDAIRRQPCAGKATDRDQNSDQNSLNSKPGGWPAALALVLNPAGIEELAALDDNKPGDPWVVPAERFQPPPPHANPFFDPGDSGVVHTYTPCPPSAPSCLVVSSAEFTDGMGRVIRSEQANDFQAAIDRLTRHGTIVVRLPAPGDDRDAAINGAVRLEVRAINIAATRLRDDIIHLTPNSRDSGAMKKQKLIALLHNEQVRRVLWKQAVAANRPSPSIISGPANTLAFNTKALERMVQIHDTGTWP
jgi:hypothetical protein